MGYVWVMSRPLPEERTVQVRLRIPVSLHRWLKTSAVAQKRTMTAQIAYVLEKALQAQDENGQAGVGEQPRARACEGSE